MTERKRVLIAVSTYPPAFGGAGLQVHLLYTRLAKQLPIELTALTQSGRGQASGRSQHEGVDVWRVDPSLPLASQFIAAGRALLRGRDRRFHLVHAADSPPVVLAACGWARLLGIPTIREITLPEPPTAVTWKAGLLRSTFTHATQLFGVNDSVRAAYAAMDIPPQRIRMNPYPVDLDRFFFPLARLRREARTALGFGDGDIVHFILGRIQPRKNQLLAVNSLTLLPAQHKLVLAGPLDDDSYIGRIRRTISGSDLEARVILLPRVQEDPALLYHAADVYQVPSLREGGPNVMLEALCCGVPVIANEGLGVTRYVRDGINGYNVPLTAQAFAEAALKLTDIVVDMDRRRAIAEDAARSWGAEALDPIYAQQIARLLKLDQ